MPVPKFSAIAASSDNESGESLYALDTATGLIWERLWVSNPVISRLQQERKYDEVNRLRDAARTQGVTDKFDGIYAWELCEALTIPEALARLERLSTTLLSEPKP